MKILVTGGLGFVGSHLVDKLIEEGNEVHVVDDLSSESASLENLNPKAIYKTQYPVESLFKIYDTQFDKIFHLAAKARIQPSFDNPLEYIRSNGFGTAVVMEYARKYNCGIVVYATTSSKNHGSPYITPYTYSKVCGEDILKTYSHCYDLNCAMATFYNVYGPREPRVGEWATVVAKFGRQLAEGSKLTVVGDGLQTRDFTHVDDIVDGLIKISEGQWKAHNFDLGRGNPISIIDLAKLYTTDMSKIQFVPLRKNEGLHTESEWRKTETLLKWRATKNLKEYIKQNK